MTTILIDFENREVVAESGQSPVQSGTMHTPTQALCDETYEGFITALSEGAITNKGYIQAELHDFTLKGEF